MLSRIWTPDVLSCHNCELCFDPYRPTWLRASIRQTTDFTPGYIADRSCREELLDLSLAWCRHLHNVDNDCYFRSEFTLEVTMSARAHCPRQTILLAVYLKCAGKQRFWLAASGRGSSPHIYVGMRAMCPVVGLSTLIRQSHPQLW
jgi:hypothetical protein